MKSETERAHEEYQTVSARLKAAGYIVTDSLSLEWEYGVISHFVLFTDSQAIKPINRGCFDRKLRRIGLHCDAPLYWRWSLRYAGFDDYLPFMRMLHDRQQNAYSVNVIQPVTSSK